MKAFSRALLALIVFSVLTGLAYPLVITGLARLLFPEKAGGSMVVAGDRIVGSALIGQKFTDPRYFHGRPSASDYDATNSGGTNLAPSNAKFIEEVGKRISLARRENGLSATAPIPADLVLASASGLDPTSASRLPLSSLRGWRRREVSPTTGYRRSSERPPTVNTDSEATGWSMCST